MLELRQHSRRFAPLGSVSLSIHYFPRLSTLVEQSEPTVCILYAVWSNLLAGGFPIDHMGDDSKVAVVIYWSARREWSCVLKHVAYCSCPSNPGCKREYSFP